MITLDLMKIIQKYFFYVRCSIFSSINLLLKILRNPIKINKVKLILEEKQSLYSNLFFFNHDVDLFRLLFYYPIPHIIFKYLLNISSVNIIHWDRTKLCGEQKEMPQEDNEVQRSICGNGRMFSWKKLF